MRSVLEPIDIGLDVFAARVAALRAEGREPLGLVLAGGSARAYAHIGVLQVLEEAGIRPDFIVANSMGAVIGMLYAAGLSPSTIARIVTTISPDTRLDLVLPTSGGFINAERFVAAVESFVGDIDLSDTKIPIVVTAEDLRSRRQVRLAAGSFSRVMATTFAMPAIFEPVPFGDYLLVDGGLTNIVPVDLAARYSSSLIVSTALYDRSMDFGNPISVLNRSLDISKTRAGIRGIVDKEPYVIRNRVEDISYMQFANPAGIIALGRMSAEAAMADIVRGLGPAYLGTAMPPGLESARKAYDASVPGVLAVLKRGAIPPTPPTSRYRLILKLTDDFEASPLALDSQSYAGLETFNEKGRAQTTFGALVGLSRNSGRQWGLAFGLAANPADTLMIQASLRLWGDFGTWSGYAVDPRSFEALGSISWPSKGDALLFVPRVDGSLSYQQKTGVLTWNGGAGLVFETSWGGRNSATRLFGLEGFAALKGGVFAEGGVFAGGSGGTIAWGPDWNLKLGLAYPDMVGLRARAAGRWNAEGFGIPLLASDAFRGPLPSETSPLALVFNFDLVWLATALEFDAGETILVKNIEAAPYFDYVRLAGGTSDFESFAAGLSLSLTASLAGLAPFDLSLFAGLDRTGFPVLGLRSGRLFPAFK
jgi:predicted acylesterase/phospholipase RssA